MSEEKSLNFGEGSGALFISKPPAPCVPNDIFFKVSPGGYCGYATTEVVNRFREYWLNLPEYRKHLGMITQYDYFMVRSQSSDLYADDIANLNTKLLDSEANLLRLSRDWFEKNTDATRINVPIVVKNEPPLDPPHDQVVS